MHVLEAGDWSLLLPPDWQADEVEGAVVIEDRDGVGCLEFSELYKDSGEFEVAELEQFADASYSWAPVTLGSFSGLYSELVEDGAAIREWCVFAGDLLLYITYSCEVENQGMDDSAVNDILDTLRFAKGGEA
ncbi:MAG: hypothetical protein Cons2KO_22560 [Congregibacter sp.]